MTNIIELPVKDSWASGEAICIQCKHSWIAVAPTKTEELQCPKCSSIKGIWKYGFVPSTNIWSCSCGNDLFHITMEGHFCPKCGKTQSYPF